MVRLCRKRPGWKKGLVGKPKPALEGGAVKGSECEQHRSNLAEAT